jgi:hypothetical protein
VSCAGAVNEDGVYMWVPEEDEPLPSTMRIFTAGSRELAAFMKATDVPSSRTAEAPQEIRPGAAPPDEHEAPLDEHEAPPEEEQSDCDMAAEEEQSDCDMADESLTEDGLMTQLEADLESSGEDAAADGEVTTSASSAVDAGMLQGGTEMCGDAAATSQSGSAAGPVEMPSSLAEAAVPPPASMSAAAASSASSGGDLQPQVAHEEARCARGGLWGA